MQRVIRQSVGMCVANRPGVIVVLDQFADKLVEKRPALLNAGKVQHQLLDPAEGGSDRSCAVDGPFDERALLKWFLVARGINDRVQRRSIAKLVLEKAVI